MMKTKRIGIVVGLVVIAVAFFVVRSFFVVSFKYAGTIEATRVDLPSRMATVVHAIFVQEGEFVKKDQVLAELACEDVALNQSLAEDNFQRASQLKRTGSISKEAFDQAQNKKMDADIKRSWCKIRSPVDGTVLTRFLEPKEWTNPGSKMLTVADLAHPWSYFYVPQEVMSSLKLGQSVLGRVPELGKNFSGKIVKINDEAEFTPKNVQTQSERTRLVFGVKVDFNNEEGLLKPGITILSDLVGGDGSPHE